jgi:DHA2 family lincomycin resistance protein-like MFS transporter
MKHMLKIRDIMEREPYTCGKNATIGDVIRQLADSRISGIPIVDDENRLAGFVTDVDLMRYIAHKKPQIFDWCEMMPVIVDEESAEDKMRGILSVPALEIASKKKHCVDAELELDEAGDIFREERVLKVAVVEDGKVVGVVSRSAVLRQLLANVLPEEKQT